MRDALDAIAKLRIFIAEQHEPGSSCEWLAHRLADYFNQRGAITLEEALSLKPGRGEAPWWKQEAISVRDAAIKRIAESFSTEPISQQARQVLAAAERYRQGRWRFDRDHTVAYDDPQTQALHRLMVVTGGRVLKSRTVREVLTVK